MPAIGHVTNAQAYKEAYGDDESVAELIPYMLERFLDGDRQFNGRRRQKPALGEDAGSKAN